MRSSQPDRHPPAAQHRTPRHPAPRRRPPGQPAPRRRPPGQPAPAAVASRATRRWFVGLLGVLLVAGMAVLLGPAEPASAHAAIVDTTPAQQSVLGASPEVVTVTFSEPVSLVPGRTQVLGPDGKRINDGEPTVRGATLRIPVRAADRPLGTYLVSYRVISADTHPVAGGFTFSVGAPSATAPEPPRDSVHPSVRVAVPAAKYLGYAGLVLVLGPALLLGLLWPRRLSRRGPIRLVRAGVALLGVSTLASLWLQAPYASGASILDVSAADLRQAVDTDFGLVLAVRLVILVLVAIMLPAVLRGQRGPGIRPDGQRRPGPDRRRGLGLRRLRAWALLPLGLAGLVTWPLVGHAIAAPVPLASGILDVAHLAAMATWLGGLITLFAFLLPGAHPRVLAVLLPIWSRWATVAVVWLVGGGLGQLLIEVGGFGPLVGTAYGRLVVAKVALLAAVLAAATYARRLVRRRTLGPDGDPARPPERTGGGDPAGTSGREAGERRRLRRTVGLEIAGAATILALSAVLVQTTPARNAGVEAAAAASDSFAQTLTCPLYTLQFDIYPVQLGDNNTVHAYLYTADGKPLPAVAWTLTTALPAKGIEPVSAPMLGLNPQHALGAVAFPVPGDWQLRFTIRTTDIDQATVSTTVRVR